LGHARVLTAFDVIARYLRHKGYEVNYVRNITDIDDKIISRAQENGEAFDALTERFIKEMHVDSKALGIEMPNSEPRATAHIDGIIKMVQTLIEKGYAYTASNGDVYYSVRKFEGYGKLSGKVLDDLEAGARIEIDEMKQDPLDFVLWKHAKADEPHWESPWGIGRPGWHIECSVMSTCCLGNNFDIHGGGPDLKFPHHENEIAQSEAATGSRYANNWMHAGAVRIDGEKMSKSLGNFFTIREILEKYHPETVRFFLLSSHYRSSINYSEDSLKEAQVKLERFYNALAKVENHAITAKNNDFSPRFFTAMDDDFNTAEAMGVLFDLVREVNKAEGDKKLALGAQLRELGAVLGILQLPPEEFLQSGSDVDAEYVEMMIQKRIDAKKAKDFATADGVRDELLAKGITLRDGPEGTTWAQQ
jgi:cysteinyl-tRNA synthetase